MTTVNTVSMSAKNALDLVGSAIEKFNAHYEPEGIKIFAENPVIANDIKKLLEHSNFNVEILDDEGKISLSGIPKFIPDKIIQDSENLKNQNIENISIENSKTENSKKIPEAINSKISFAILISNSNFSRNKNYGKYFFNKIIKSLLSFKHNPDVIALINEGVKLALYNTSSCDFLKELEKKGTKILVSGSCADNFGITESIGAGIIAEIDEILEAVYNCDKIINL